MSRESGPIALPLGKRLFFLGVVFALLACPFAAMEWFLRTVPVMWAYQSLRSVPPGQAPSFVAFPMPTRRFVHPREEYLYPFTPDRHQFWRLKPNFVLPARASLVMPPTILRTNSLGFRGPEFSPMKNPNSFRVVCLGDSVTFGYGRTNHQSATFPALLQSRLTTRHPGARFEVVNAGVVGHSSLQGRAAWEQVVSHYEQNMLIVGFGYNDGLADPFSDAVKAREFNSMAGRLDAALMTFEVWRLAKEWSRHVRPAPSPAPPGTVYGHPRCSIEEYKANLKAIFSSAQARNVQVIAFRSIFQAPWRNSYGKVLDESAAEFNIPVLDMPARFEALVRDNSVSREYATEIEGFAPSGSRPPRSAGVLMDDRIHPNALGNLVIADMLVPLVEDAARQAIREANLPPGFRRLHPPRVAKVPGPPGVGENGELASGANQ